MKLIFIFFLIAIYEKDITFDTENIEISINNPQTEVQIPAGHPRVHYIQYTKPLTPERRFFFIEIIDIGTKSKIVLGISSTIITENKLQKLPGELAKSVGYHSSGSMLYNGKSEGNMMGHKCSKGDTMGLEIEVFEKKMSVAIFSKNFKPVGTRYLTLEDHDSFLPTIAVVSEGEEIKMNIYWQTVVSMPPHFNIVSRFLL